MVCVCVLLLVTVLTVGVLRLRAAHKRAAEEEVEMAWDDTALNITVNPLEVSYTDNSVADPDPRVFGPPGSGFRSISQRFGSGSGSFYHQAKIVRKTSISTLL